VRFARGTPWRLIGLNATGVAIVWALALAVVPAQGAWGGAPARTTLLAVGSLGIFWVALLLAFFRDPDRQVGAGVVSPADGKVREAFAHGEMARVSILLGVFDVHVIRAPFPCEVESLERRKGARRPAYSKESEFNERLVVSLKGAGEWVGTRIKLTLIAGAFADRIEPYVAAGQALQAGERLGIIKFGSRTDLELEGAAVTLQVREGNTVKAAQSAVMKRGPPK
jgi:phosphatidylserine decarboxylase